MTDTIRSFVTGILKGVRDCIVGTFRLYRLSHDSPENDARRTASPESSSSPSTTLARRRAERMKNQPSTARKDSQPKVFQRILLCCAWNGGVFWASIWLFNGVVIPCLELLSNFMFAGSSTHNVVWSYTGPVLVWTFSALWVLPLFVLSKVINAFWFQDIADAAYRKSRGRPQLLPSLSKVIADVLFSLLLQSLFLIQGMLMKVLPLSGIGDVVYLVHMCLLYSLYAFEYKWFNMGWEVHKRLIYIENNWPYFVGFGLPLAILTSLPSSHVVSGCVFSILFPLLIVSGNEAEAMEQPFDVPIQFFSVVVSMSNRVFRKSIGKGSPGVKGVGDSSAQGRSTPTQDHRAGGGSPAARGASGGKRVRMMEHS